MISEALAKGTLISEALAKGTLISEALAKGTLISEALAKGTLISEALAKGIGSKGKTRSWCDIGITAGNYNNREKKFIEKILKNTPTPKACGV